MRTRLPREDATLGDLAVYAGRFAIAAGLIFGALVAVSGPSVLPVSIGLLGTGIAWSLHGAHRRRRPARYVEVDSAAEALRLMPENRPYSLAELGPLTILEWDFERADASGIAVKVQRVAVRSDGCDLELYITDERAPCEAWLAQFEAARAGTGPEERLTPADRALETPSTAAFAMAFGASLVAVVAVVVGYGENEPDWTHGAGAAALIVAATAAWMAIGRRGLARLFGGLAGLALFARPFIFPAQLAVIGGWETLGPFAEPHLSYLAGGIISIGCAFVVTRPPGAPVT